MMVEEDRVVSFIETVDVDVERDTVRGEVGFD